MANRVQARLLLLIGCGGSWTPMQRRFERCRAMCAI
jgi:hypothetical protein